MSLSQLQDTTERLELVESIVSLAKVKVGTLPCLIITQAPEPLEQNQEEEVGQGFREGAKENKAHGLCHVCNLNSRGLFLTSS